MESPRKFDVFPFLYATIGIVMVTCGTAMIARDIERKKAVDAGVGSWVIDAASGVSKFEYGVRRQE